MAQILQVRLWPATIEFFDEDGRILFLPINSIHKIAIRPEAERTRKDARSGYTFAISTEDQPARIIDDILPGAATEFLAKVMQDQQWLV